MIYTPFYRITVGVFWLPIKGYKSLTLKDEVQQKIIEKARKAKLSPSDFLTQLLTAEVAPQ